jgi:hypothetical protein
VQRGEINMWILDMEILTDWAIECFKNGDVRKGRAIAKAHEHMKIAKYGRS